MVCAVPILFIRAHGISPDVITITSLMIILNWDRIFWHDAANQADGEATQAETVWSSCLIEYVKLLREGMRLGYYLCQLVWARPLFTNQSEIPTWSSSAFWIYRKNCSINTYTYNPCFWYRKVLETWANNSRNLYFCFYFSTNSKPGRGHLLS